MANNWIGGTTPPSDPSTFDYDTAAQKVQRQRAAAQALQSLGMQGNQGQFIKNGDFMGYAGGNTLGSTAARIAAALLGANANNNADGAQKQLGLDSQSALTWALDPHNSPAGQRGAADQAQHEADMELQRENARGNNTTQGGDFEAPHPTTQPVQQAPTQAPIAPAPLAPSVQQMASKVLAAPPAVAPAATAITRTPPNTMSVAGGPSTFASSNDLSRTLAPPTNLPVGAKGALSSDDMAFAAKMLGGVPTSKASTSGTRQNAPQTFSAPAPTSALPAMPPQAPAAPVMPQAPAQAPQPAAPTLEDVARSLGIDPTASRGPGDPSLAQQVQEVAATQSQLAHGTYQGGDPRPMVDQASAKANANASFGDQMANLQQLSRTGPMGQQLANAMMQSQYSKDWGEIKNADGATVGVYNKRDPNQTIGFQGTNNGTKTMDTAMNIVKSTDYTNPDAMHRLNQNLAALGQAPMTPDQVRGMNMTADQRITATKGNADAISTISTKRGEAAAQVADLSKINRDLQYAMAISNDTAGKFANVKGSIESWWGGGENQQVLGRILNDSTLMSIMQDKGGSGTAGVGLMKAYQDHGLKMTMTPAAVQQGLQQIQQAMSERVSAKQAEVSAHDYALQQLGYQPQQTQPTRGGATPNGRAPGNYSF